MRHTSETIVPKYNMNIKLKIVYSIYIKHEDPSPSLNIGLD